MPTDTIQKDAVTIRIQERLDRLNGQLTSMEKRRDHLEKGVVSESGDLRSNLAGEIAIRDIEINVIRKRIAEMKKSLAEAIEDLPRREHEQKRADQLELKAQELDKEATSLVEKLRQIQKATSEFRIQVQAAQRLAGMTAGELKKEDQAREETLEKQRQENRYIAESQLKAAEMELENGKKDQIPFDEIQHRERRVAIYRQKLDRILEAV
jgi:hypothetical protein